MKTKSLFLLLLSLFCMGSTMWGFTPSPQKDKDFASFLKHFTSSAAFQYSRIKFPLKTAITFMSYDGETEKTFPFSKDKWMLLNADMLNVGSKEVEGGGTYIAKFEVDTPTHKEFQTGYEDSEVDLKVVFDLINGKWFVTDCFSAWYGYDMSIEEFKDAVREIQRQNTVFMKVHP